MPWKLFMTGLYSIAFYVGAVGYFASIVLYGLTFNDVNVQELPFFWALTFAMIATWLIAILKLKANEQLQGIKREGGFKPLALIQGMFYKTPTWMTVIAGISFVFAMISFGVLMSSSPGVPAIIDNEYVMHNHGNIIKKLTEKEYQHELAISARMTVGHYLAFFGVGTTMLYPYPDYRKE